MAIFGCARSLCCLLLATLFLSLPNATESLAARYKRPCSRTAVSTLPSTRWHSPYGISWASSLPLRHSHEPVSALYPKHPPESKPVASSLSNIIRSIAMKWLSILKTAWQRLWSPERAASSPVHIELTRNIEVVVAEHGQLLGTKRIIEMKPDEGAKAVEVALHASDETGPPADTTTDPAAAAAPCCPSGPVTMRSDVGSNNGPASLIAPMRELARAAVEEATKSATAASRESCSAFDLRHLPSAFQTPLSTWQLPEASLMEAKALVASALSANDISLETVPAASVTGVLAVLITQATFSTVLPALFALLRSMTQRDSSDASASHGTAAAVQQAQAVAKAAATVDAMATLVASAVAQYSVPLRVSFALSIAPWVDVNITKWLVRGKETKRGNRR